MTLLTPDGTRETLEPGGWEHFTPSKNATRKPPKNTPR
jgi:hypothetical protein